MKRTSRDNRDLPHPKPVEKIELSEQHTKLRLTLTVVLVLIGAGFIAYGFSSLFTADVGWAEIESNAPGVSCATDFVFFYRLGDGNMSATAEKKAVTALYSDATERAYQLFTNDLEYDGVYNVYYINRHPNEEIQVDPVLYAAFSLVRDYGDRGIYLGPVYAQYDDLFFCTDDSQAADFDPRLNPEVAAEYAAVCAYARDKDAVDIELLGNNKIRLKVSVEYLAFAKEHFIESYIDFYWMKNAFIADYLADTLIAGGYTNGCLSSYDGFIRNLDSSGESYSYGIAHRVGQTVYPAARMEYSGPASIVNLRDYSADGSEYYYSFANGEIRTPYLDIQDGLCKSAISDLTCYSRKLGCGEILLQMIPTYIADSFQEEQLAELAGANIYSVYCGDGTVFYNDPSLALTALYNGNDIHYHTKLVQ